MTTPSSFDALLEAERQRQMTPCLSPFDSQLGLTQDYDDLDLEASDVLSELFPAASTISSTQWIQDSTNIIGVTSTLQTLSPSPIRIRNSPTPPIGASPVGATVDMPVRAVGSATVTTASPLHDRRRHLLLVPWEPSPRYCPMESHEPERSAMLVGSGTHRPV